jgi:ABC-type Zn uptake system ZnuABC Zn-binding protein ZnuA
MKHSSPLLNLFCLISLLSGAAAFAGSEVDTKSGQYGETRHPDLEAQLPDISAVQLRDGQKLKVLASTSIVGDVVANVGGDDIELTVLIGIGQDPHSYEPKPSSLRAVEQAHVVFVNGFGLEEGLLETIESAARGVIVAVSAGIEPIDTDQRYGSQHDESSTAQDRDDAARHDEGHREHGTVDPHVWFDPTNVIVWVANIEQALSGADPENRQGYHERAEEYLKRLETLDQSIRRKLSTVPENRRKLVTDHYLFNYFADEYGFKVIGAILPGISTSAEASARQFANLVELLRKEGITTIFVGSTAGRGLEKLAAAVADELGEQVRIIYMLTGSLAERGMPGDTYIGYMEYNLNQIMNGLTR